MKVKIVGFKVDMGRPTYNKTVEISRVDDYAKAVQVGARVLEALEKSDFLSVRRVNECLPTT